ncbi:MAG: hypothetical protein V4504_02060 [Patescibacteria group bacterium]
MKKIFQKLYRDKYQSQKGFALLFSVIIASIIFSITLGISNVAYKENLLTTTGKDSNNAFFSADAGIECALYIDKVANGDMKSYLNECAGFGINLPATTPLVDNFDFIISNPNQSISSGCAIVNIAKIPDSIDPAVINTVITSHGYNSSDEPKICLSGFNRTERVLEVTF